MLYFKDIPVVIEPGVAALEVGLISAVKKRNRLFFVPFERVDLTHETAALLPMVVSSSAPHVFSMHKDLTTSPFLLVYDYLGKLSAVYSADPKTRTWVRNDAAPEQIGDTVTQFSVRISFNDHKSRDKFLLTLSKLASDYQDTRKIYKADAVELVKALTASRVGPVVLPIAIAKHSKTSAV